MTYKTKPRGNLTTYTCPKTKDKYFTPYYRDFGTYTQYNRMIIEMLTNQETDQALDSNEILELVSKFEQLFNSYKNEETEINTEIYQTRKKTYQLLHGTNIKSAEELKTHIELLESLISQGIINIKTYSEDLSDPTNLSNNEKQSG